MSLSMPRGPSVVRTVSATAVQALMLLSICPRPCEVSVPSLRRMICGCIIDDMARGGGRGSGGAVRSRRRRVWSEGVAAR
jgi:hypothetical protein